MRVLTVRQPWAWALIYGGKPIENRTRNIAGSYRGPVAIQAGLTIDKDALDPASPRFAVVGQAWQKAHGWSLESITPTFETGAIIGVVDLVGSHPASFHCEHPGDWDEISGWHLEVENPRPFGWMHPNVITAKGRLGLWKPTDELHDQITDALERLARIKENA